MAVSPTEIARRVSIKYWHLKQTSNLQPDFGLIVLEEVRGAGYREQTEVSEKVKEVKRIFAKSNKARSARKQAYS